MSPVVCVHWLQYWLQRRHTLHLSIPGWVIMDRSGKHFGSILNFIRDDFLPMPDTKAECMEMLAEAK